MVVEEEEDANEDRHRVDILQALMVSRFEMTLHEGEPSKRQVEEE